MIIKNSSKQNSRDNPAINESLLFNYLVLAKRNSTIEIKAMIIAKKPSVQGPTPKAILSLLASPFPLIHED